MNKSNVTAIAHNYWASHLGIARDQLFSKTVDLISHGGELSDYPGIFALFREGMAIVSLPNRFEFRRTLSSRLSTDSSPATLAEALEPYASKFIGPALLAYANDVPAPPHPARELIKNDEPAINFLRIACDDTEWEHGGPGDLTRSVSGIFYDNQLIALASYEIWGHSIAHISVITHPEYRGHGFGASAVAHVAARALADGLLPQYRTLESNAPSMRIAKALGFTKCIVACDQAERLVLEPFQTGNYFSDRTSIKRPVAADNSASAGGFSPNRI